MAGRSDGADRTPGAGRLRRAQRLRRRRALQIGARLGLCLGLLALVAGVAYPFVAPFRLGQEMSGKVRKARAELADLERQNRALERDLEYLRSDEGVEALARRNGYRRPGEQIFRIRSGAPGEETRRP